ncbi:MAG: sugar transferase [Rubellimicrobium sp.]|nr:sugar transferase [Rubellimicrobium sp.]
MLELPETGRGAVTAYSTRPFRGASTSVSYRLFKRTFDFVGGLVLVAATIVVGLILLAINPFLNPGPLFYVQRRMGQGCRPFSAYKFRTMVPTDEGVRGPFDPVESHRITRLGCFLRKARIDEFPQGINVLLGQMSLIGPRPDYLDHACIYLGKVPGYRERHCVKPGITGLAQIEIGYADTSDAVRDKVAADLRYIRDRRIALDLSIAWRTVAVMLSRAGT